MFDVADVCPKCGKPQLPPFRAESKATARACQNCGKRMKFNDKPDNTSPSEAYINSALGSTLGHMYSFSGSYRVGNWRRGMDD